MYDGAIRSVDVVSFVQLAKRFIMHFFTWEVALSASLLIGALVNLRAAWEFLVSPSKAVSNLGIDLGAESGSKGTSGSVIILNLVGVCLIALGMFYLVTAIGPLQQPWNVVVASLSRLAGAVFYGWILVKSGGPASFKKFLMLNLLLALAHIVFLALTPTGWDSLLASWSSFLWVPQLT